MVKRALLVTLVGLSSSILYIEYLMRHANVNHTQLDYDAIIILGAKVRDDGPSLSLISRMDAALKAYQHKSVPVVLSGGQGPDEPMTEAQAMFDYLSDKSIPVNMLIKEGQSKTTLENLTFAKEKLPQTSKWLIVTNDYHAYRACKHAESLLMKASCVGSPSPSHVAVKLRIREYMAIVWHSITF